jgi:GNAT superfamily N-acetyltransferase
MASELEFLTLRPVRPDEVAQLAALTFPTFRREWQGGVPMVAMAAFLGDEPLGLALARPPVGTQAEVLSLFVKQQRRSQGIGTALLGQLEEALRALGATVGTCTYSTGTDNTAAVERVLAKAGWTPPVARMLLFQADLAPMSQEKWLKGAPLDEHFALVPWTDLTEPDRETLAIWQQADEWIPEDLEPWKHEEGCHVGTSLALKLDGRVVGWVLTHVLDATTLRFSSGWVHPTLQRKGRLLTLYAAAGERALADGFQRGSWTVPLHHEGKAAFARRWMARVARCRETRGSAKLLVLD